MIPTKPPPSFRNPDKWSTEFIDFVSKCLVKNPELRTTAQELMEVYLTTISDIGRIIDHHCSNFLFIINLDIPHDKMNFNG
jgi:serine/threonine kinase 3